MSLTLYQHPLASFCWKVLIALYENGTPFEARLVDLGNEAERAAFLKLTPMGKMPVLRDEARDRTIPETSIIIEYLDTHYPGPKRLIPAEPELALRTRLSDRFFDLYVQEPMQKIVGDELRPEGKRDPHGVAQARAALRSAYAFLEQEMATRRWAMGDDFTLADCAAAPALFYADKVVAIGEERPNTAAYLSRLMARPSFARVLEEAKPYFHMFPGKRE
ncbi:glutathione S-transferase family protein [Pyxidicoccus parkwayensis]|uniref:Glutathione S-transferase family protein n=1 Tax=Pyxidicoccus parkwayensis TaxID=2813578 RepID=A0ABX7NKQ4_9BACT|nr:glutathione S-transferase family protein [Pyxidicoccus parkwaysis]QSQ19003.1 glutathione S-transferase family protein [Pyxidicoccus parkwaysis]